MLLVRMVGKLRFEHENACSLGPIFFLAETAEWKLAHSGVFAVVGQAFDDCEAWTAVGAGDKEIFVTWVLWVTQLSQAFVADGDVWRYN